MADRRFALSGSAAGVHLGKYFPATPGALTIAGPSKEPFHDHKNKCHRHPRESGDPASLRGEKWIPAFAGMTTDQRFALSGSASGVRRNDGPWMPSSLVVNLQGGKPDAA